MPVESFTSTVSSSHGVSDSPFKDEIARWALKHREDTPIVKGPVGETGLAGPGA
jgi:hypothetical protein